MKNRRSNGGFSLIELLIASLVVASAGTLLVSGTVLANRSGSIRVQQALAAHLLAHELAQVEERLAAGSQTEETVPSPEGTLEVSRATAAAGAPLAPLVEETIRITHPRMQTHVVTYRRPSPQS